MASFRVAFVMIGLVLALLPPSLGHSQVSRAEQFKQRVMNNPPSKTASPAPATPPTPELVNSSPVGEATTVPFAPGLSVLMRPYSNGEKLKFKPSQIMGEIERPPGRFNRSGSTRTAVQRMAISLVLDRGAAAFAMAIGFDGCIGLLRDAQQRRAVTVGRAVTQFNIVEVRGYNNAQCKYPIIRGENEPQEWRGWLTMSAAENGELTIDFELKEQRGDGVTYRASGVKMSPEIDPDISRTVTQARQVADANANTSERPTSPILRPVAEPTSKGEQALPAGAYRIAVLGRLGPTPSDPATAPMPSIAWDERKGWKGNLPFNQAHDWFMTRTISTMSNVYYMSYLSKSAATSKLRIYGMRGDYLAIEQVGCRNTWPSDPSRCTAFSHRFLSRPAREGFAVVADGHDPRPNRNFATVHLEWNDDFDTLGPVLLSQGRQLDRLYGFEGPFSTGICIGGFWAIGRHGAPGGGQPLWLEAASENCIFADDAALINDFARARAITMQAALLASDQVRLVRVPKGGYCDVYRRTWRGQVVSEERVCFPASEVYEWTEQAELDKVGQNFVQGPPQR